MVIPQGMSYANLAGLPYAFGLYGAFVPTIVYAVLGSSRQLAVGPVAVTSILLGNGLSDFIGSNDDPNNPSDPELQIVYNHAAVQVRMQPRNPVLRATDRGTAAHAHRPCFQPLPSCQPPGNQKCLWLLL